MGTYSADLRRSIVRAYEGGHGSQRQLAQLFGVSVSFVQKILQHYWRTGDMLPKPHGGGQTSKLSGYVTEIDRVRRQWPEASLQELCARFAAETDVVVSRATMSRALRRLSARQYVSDDPHEFEATEDRSSPAHCVKVDEGSEG